MFMHIYPFLSLDKLTATRKYKRAAWEAKVSEAVMKVTHPARPDGRGSKPAWRSEPNRGDEPLHTGALSGAWADLKGLI